MQEGVCVPRIEGHTTLVIERLGVGCNGGRKGNAYAPNRDHPDQYLLEKTYDLFLQKAEHASTWARTENHGTTF